MPASARFKTSGSSFRPRPAGVGTSGLNGFDFHVAGPDLTGFYFVNKILSDADFSALTLEGANSRAAPTSRAPS